MLDGAVDVWSPGTVYTDCMSESTAQTYRDVAKEHLDRAYRLHRQEEFFLSHYLAGLAVEAHLKSHVRRRTSQFNARHDLRELAREANFFDDVSPNVAQSFAADFQTLNLRWRSSQRYDTTRQFLDYMNEIRAEFNQSGDRWKNLSRTMLNLADRVIKEGELKWSAG